MSPLENLLNQVAYENRRRVKEDIRIAMERYKSLLPKISNFVQNNGMESKIVSLNGTIPITYAGVQYNLPIEVFIMERYPTTPPKAYLRPTPTMTIKANHRHVDMQGCVYLPYLHDWNPMTCTLVGLVDMCSSVFSFDPPLFSRPAGSAAATTNTTNVTGRASFASSNGNTNNPVVYAQPVSSSGSSGINSNSNNNYNPYVTAAATMATVGTVAATTSATVGTASYHPYGAMNNTSSSSTSAQPYNPYPVVTASPVQATASPYSNNSSPLATVTTIGAATATTVAGTGTSSSKNPYASALATAYQTNNGNSSSSHNTTPTLSAKQAAFERREDLILEVTSKLQQEIYKQQQQLKQDIDEEFINQRYLERSSNQLHRTKEELTDLIERLQSSNQSIEEKKESLKKWDEEESSKSKPELEELLFSYDDLSNQILRLNAEANAIDDLTYYLEKGLVQRKIDCSVFLKEARAQARRQFLIRAHLLKINSQLAPPPPPSSTMGPSAHAPLAPALSIRGDSYAAGYGNNNNNNNNYSYNNSPFLPPLGPGSSSSINHNNSNGVMTPQSVMQGVMRMDSSSHYHNHHYQQQQQPPYSHGINQHATNYSQPPLGPSSYGGGGGGVVSREGSSKNPNPVMTTGGGGGGVGPSPGPSPSGAAYSPYTFQPYK